MEIRKPHKCPVCDGDGKVAYFAALNSVKECHACKGTGIVWETITSRLTEKAKRLGFIEVGPHIVMGRRPRD